MCSNTHADDRDMYECWQDEVTQRGYNGAYYDTFEQYAATDIARFRFWVTAVDKASGERVGSLRLGLDDEWPDPGDMDISGISAHGLRTCGVCAGA